MASAPDTSAVAKLLSQTTLGALLKEQQHIVTIKDNASVDQTLRVSCAGQRRCAAQECRDSRRRTCRPALAQVLASRKILSAPVVSTVPDQDVEHLDTAVPHDCIKDVAGFIDIRDVLSSFLQGAPCRGAGGRSGWLRRRHPARGGSPVPIPARPHGCCPA
jgi:hypothetical protein